MSFFEELAAALDREGIESRGEGQALLVPITSDVEIHFEIIDDLLPAVNVYIAGADVDEIGEVTDIVLVSVVFSVDDAVRAVARHMATDQVVTVMRDLLEGTDERIADLEFTQSFFDPQVVTAPVAEDSEIHVLVEVVDEVATASVAFIAGISDYDDEAWEGEEPEMLDLGVFTDFERLFDVLSLAAAQAEAWEKQLVPLDEDDDDVDYEFYIDAEGSDAAEDED
ncbi:MAG: hypothetical protein SPI77_03235 [Corynebacterium sp.]|nr:hypothetical protein [Corynebacterium sp.]